MTFGKGSYFPEFSGTLAKHAKKGDKFYAVVFPKRKRRTDEIEATKQN